MDIKAGDDYLTLPEAIDRHSAQLLIYSNGSPEKDPQSYARQLMQVDFGWLMDRKTKLPKEADIVGFPCYFAIALIEGKQRLFLWPTPAQDLFARFRYCPAMKEI